MNNIYEQMKNNMEHNKDLFDLYTITTNDKLKLSIYKQRYNNIINYVDNNIKNLTNEEMNMLKNYYFFDNSLKEMNIIGTDLYINAKFIKQQVPFLYRCVGKDNEYKNNEVELEEHVNTIFNQCKEQIETGGKGRLYSYSKCFGRMLYKYATVLNDLDKVIIEIRNNAWVNTIKERKENSTPLMLQEYLMQCNKKNETAPLPYFSVDMSNARGNDVKNLKRWIESYLGKQNWHYCSEIVDPIGDAEVVTNFTNTINNTNGEDDSIKEIMAENVFRSEFNIGKFCNLLYQYFKNYYVKSHNGESESFDNFIRKSINTLSEDYKEKFEGIMVHTEENDITEFLNKNINWDLEKLYITRRKDENSQTDEKTPKPMTIYKGENAEWKTKIWKDILFEAVRGKYLYINYGGNNEV